MHNTIPTPLPRALLAMLALLAALAQSASLK